MRRIVRRSLAPIAALSCLATLASASTASADTTTTTVERAGKPWLIVANAGTTSSSPVANAANAEARARLVATQLSSASARLSSSLVATSTERFGDGDTIVHFEQSHL